MTPLTEHQFHTVWTNAVGMNGYDKQLFRDLLQKMKASGEIVDDEQELPKEEPSPLMEILTAELVHRNIRERIPGGVHITFLTSDNVKKEDYFTIYALNKKEYEFKVVNIKTEPNGLLLITAVEVGYYATKLDHTGIDLRTIIGCELFLVTDEKIKAGIYERSCWC